MRAVFAFVTLANRAAALELPIPSLDGTSWRVGLNIGREPGTAMPQEWAASGARLAMPVDVTFAPDEAADAETKKVSDSKVALETLEQELVSLQSS